MTVAAQAGQNLVLSCLGPPPQILRGVQSGISCQTVRRSGSRRSASTPSPLALRVTGSSRGTPPSRFLRGTSPQPASVTTTLSARSRRARWRFRLR